MKTTEIELAGKCIEYCRNKLFTLRHVKDIWLATNGCAYWSERMEKELQQLEVIFKDEEE